MHEHYCRTQRWLGDLQSLLATQHQASSSACHYLLTSILHSILKHSPRYGGNTVDPRLGDSQSKGCRHPAQLIRRRRCSVALRKTGTREPTQLTYLKPRWKHNSQLKWTRIKGLPFLCYTFVPDRGRCSISARRPVLNAWLPKRACLFLRGTALRHRFAPVLSVLKPFTLRLY